MVLSHIPTQYGILKLEGYLREETAPQELQRDMSGSAVSLTTVSETGDTPEIPLFRGKIEHVAVRRVGELYYAKLTAITATSELDQGKKRRSFQNDAMSYGELVSAVLSDTPGDADPVGHLTAEKRFCNFQPETGASGAIHTISFRYDKDRRMTTVSDCTGAVMEYQYNCLNKRVLERRKLDEGLYQTTQYEYDAAGRGTVVVQSADKDGCGHNFITTRYTYDKTGNIIKIQLPGGGEIRREYDAADRLIAEEHREMNRSIKNRSIKNGQ